MYLKETHTDIMCHYFRLYLNCLALIPEDEIFFIHIIQSREVCCAYMTMLSSWKAYSCLCNC